MKLAARDRGGSKPATSLSDVLVAPTGTVLLAGVERVAKGASAYNFQVAINQDYSALAGATPVRAGPVTSSAYCTDGASWLTGVYGAWDDPSKTASEVG